MVSVISPIMSVPAALTLQQIEARLKTCPRLPSLRSIDSAMRELVHADTRYTHQIADIVRRDPSLTARLLKLVNSVYYALATPVKNIEEAVFYLGVRQVRQLVMATPVIEDFQRLTAYAAFPWRSFWQHCIGTAVLTRELLASSQSLSSEMHYVAGLIHDVGKIAMAAVFTDYFEVIYGPEGDGVPSEDWLAHERQILGIDHVELAALYLQQHHLPPELVAAVRFHHSPHLAGDHSSVAAAIQIADLLARGGDIGHSGNQEPVDPDSWLLASGWDLLFPPGSETDRELTTANIRRTMVRLPNILEGLV